MKMKTFERVLRQENYAENTIVAYLYAVRTPDALRPLIWDGRISGEPPFLQTPLRQELPGTEKLDQPDCELVIPNEKNSIFVN